MTNLTKAIAVLGVVAGLGVAALPLSSYAANTTVTWGTGTENTDYGTDGSGNKWVKTDVGVTLTIEDALSIEADKDNTTNKIALDETNKTGAVNLTIVTNNKSGYNLHLAGTTDGDATSLVGKNTGEKIVAGGGTFASPAAFNTSAGSQWGYRVANANATLTQFDTADVYAAVTADQEIIKTTAPTGADGDVTTVTFGYGLKDGQAADTYEGKVTFTATNNVVTAPGA